MRRMFPEEELAMKVASSSITQLTNEEINKLQAGDIVTKKTGNMFHTYIVSYKEDGQGICLTYSAAGYQETVSYDLIDGVWTYNSTDVVLVNQMEEIKDAEGHLRFIEGTPATTAITGLTYTYVKWSLSGTHLMCVVAGNIADGTSIVAGGMFINLASLPKWIKDKIVTVWSSNVDYKLVATHDDTWSTTLNIGFAMKKVSADSVYIQNQNNITNNTGAVQNFRVQFDLLIDNE